MIQLNNIVKRYQTRQGVNTVLKGVNLQINAGEKILILGRNGAGKSTLIRLISGAESPTSGNITRNMSVSWPLAFDGGFQGSLTGIDNLRFICRVYGTSTEDKIDYVQDFTELGKYLREPLKTYSSGMRARLAFALSMAIEFDCYLIDEVLAVGDSRFYEKCRHELFEKRQNRAMIIVSHQGKQVGVQYESIFVLNQGQMIKFDHLDTAYDHYQIQG